MRLAYLTSVYRSYAACFYANRPGLAGQPYAVQLEALTTDAFGWNGAWKPALLPLGYEVHEIFSNIEPLQKAWAREHGNASWPTGWRTEVPLRQLKSFAPDVLLIDDPRSFDRIWLSRLRESCSSLRLVVGFSGSASYDPDTIRAYDVILSCTKAYVASYRREGCRAYYLRHGFNTAVMDYLQRSGKRAAEVCFVGGLVRAAGYHLERELLFEALLDAVPLRIHSSQSGIGFWDDVVETTMRRGIYLLMQTLKVLGASETARRRLPKIGRAAIWTALPMRQFNSRLRPHLKPALYGLEMYRALQRSAVTLNKHGDVAGEEAANCRLFEATGVGSCLLTDWKSNLSELFEPDYEVVVYSSVEECIKKARWLLEHPAEREAIAQAGQMRTLRDHTFAQRSHDLDSIIKQSMKVTNHVERAIQV